ncbi:hypothetical protein PPL_03919 [Heterostelium album PN500]|uniref:Branchpoint-bridging protein n=1 Tax=Heterostelium pallidum (strain ATCC 26659 / Pp 5 / PN500) TaxID=670386 RepID=D3B5I1_HETP5|nr:hypothetical protein PPL_03919 [Heterostelium album PN500]EFA83129.1 hypothetical protein PPL_03919 [Heterostelium album PN500]|eukprot:XP_020435246.1 hypothetical protein PPL_03919 [Heterostelium album PN500]
MAVEQQDNIGSDFNDDEDDFFRQINEIQNDYERGRPRNREEIKEEKRTRKNKWEPEKTQLGLPGVPKSLPPGLTDDQLASLIIRIRIDEITKKLTTGPIDIDTKDDRSRSPTPVYDNTGKRTNTREQRAKDKISKERHNLITQAQQINPQFRPPADYQPPNEKKTMKIYIPVKDHPEYNFIGLIIGPRGNTQKKMEKESGAKIAIRGKGSMKDGKSTKPQYNENDELHVLLTGDTQEQLEKAAVLVRQYLVPVEEGKNEHKRQQLRELAEMNGTLRERPTFFGAGGKSWQPVDIKCIHCGEVSHPSSDCPLKGQDHNMHIIEAEYLKFIEEVKDLIDLNDRVVDPYDELKASINNNNNGNGNVQNENNNNQYQHQQQQQQQHSSPPNHQQQWNQYSNNNNNNNNNNQYQQQQHHSSPPYEQQQQQQQHWNQQQQQQQGGYQQQQHHHHQQQWNQPKQHFNQNNNSSPYGPQSSYY